MRYLPNELLHLILEECDLATLKSVRLACRAFSGAATQRIFRSLSLDLLAGSHAGLRNVAEHHLLSSHVSELKVCTNLLQPHDMESFKRIHVEEQDANLDQFDLSLTPRPRDEARESFNRYRAYVKEQYSILFDEDKLPTTLLLLTKLRSLTFKQGNDEESSASWTRFGREVFGTSECFNITCWNIFHRHRVDGVDAVTTILGMFTGRSNAISSLIVDQVPYHCWERFSLAEMACRLQHCKICVENSKSRREAVEAGLHIFLKSIVSIKSLHLEITPSCLYLNRIDFDKIFAEIQLTLLEDLVLHTGLASAQELCGTLEKHKARLRSLTLVDFHLKTGTWKDALVFLSTDLRLCSIDLEGLTEGDGWTILPAVPWGQALRLNSCS